MDHQRVHASSPRHVTHTPRRVRQNDRSAIQDQCKTSETHKQKPSPVLSHSSPCHQERSPVSLVHAIRQLVLCSSSQPTRRPPRLETSPLHACAQSASRMREKGAGQSVSQSGRSGWSALACFLRGNDAMSRLSCVPVLSCLTAYLASPPAPRSHRAGSINPNPSLSVVAASGTQLHTYTTLARGEEDWSDGGG